MDRKRHSDPTYLLFPKDLHRFRTQNEITNNTARADGFSMGSPTTSHRDPSGPVEQVIPGHRVSPSATEARRDLQTL
jgi:hypothetical protein